MKRRKSAIQNLARISFLFASLAGVSSDAFAADWRATFVAPNVATHLDGTGLRIAVVGAGATANESKDAAEALRVALGTIDRVALVTGTEMLGSVIGLDDPAIVKKASSLPLDRIAIARVFRAGEGGTAAKVVVVVYDKGGAVVGALSGEEGRPIAARQATAETSGLSRSTAESVRSVTEGKGDGPSDARKQYDANYVWFEEWVAVGAISGHVHNRWTQVYKGKYKTPLEGPAFYEHIGQSEHAKAYRSTVKTKWTLGGIAIAGTVAGLVVMVLPGSESTKTIGKGEYASTVKETDHTNVVLGAAIVGLATIPGMVGMFMNPHPVDAPTARRLADEYNQALAKKLGIDVQAAAVEPHRHALSEESPALSLRITPWIGAHDARGLAAGFDF